MVAAVVDFASHDEGAGIGFYLPPGGIHVDGIGIDARVFARVRVVAIDGEGSRVV